MKKLLALLVCGLMALSLVACTSNTEPSGTDTTEPTTETTGSTTGVSMGVGQSTTMSPTSVDADHEEGKIEVNTTYALLVVDGEGKIVDLQVDVAQNSSTWDGTGTIVTEGLQGTKRERGDDYAMKETSAAMGNIEGGAEWYEQADAFEEYCIGKTVDEVLNMELGGDHNSPVDLTTSCTMSVEEFLNAIADANEHLTAVEGEVASYGLASQTTVSTSSASADGDGSVQYNVTYAGVALDADGKVLLTDIDVAQNTAKFDTTGTVLSADPIDSKQDRKDDYGMRSASPIGAEWFEQAAAFEEYCVGKTAAEIEGMELGGDHNSPVDLTSSCTMAVADFITAITKACA